MSRVVRKMMEATRNYLDSLKRGNKKFPKDSMLILFLSGILIYVILLPTNNNSSYYRKKQQESTLKAENTETTDSSTNNQDNYKGKLERELEDFLSCVDGVGKVKVLIYMNTSEEYVVEKDKPLHEIVKEGSDEKTLDTQKEETTVYTTNDYGEQVPFVSQTRKPGIEGIVIAAQGASDESIRVKLVHMAMALYGVEANKVEVLPLNVDGD